MQRVRQVLRDRAGNLLMESTVGTLVAAFVLIGVTTTMLMMAQISVAFEQGGAQRKVSATAVNEAINQASLTGTSIPEAGVERTVDGVKVKLWSSKDPDTQQTLYHARPVDCTGPGCAPYSSVVPTRGAVPDYLAHSHQVSEGRLEFTLPAGHDHFYFLVEGVHGDARLLWHGAEQLPESQIAAGETPRQIHLSSQDCIDPSCVRGTSSAAYGRISMYGKTRFPMTFTLSVRDPQEGIIPLPDNTRALMYNLSEG